MPHGPRPTARGGLGRLDIALHMIPQVTFEKWEPKSSLWSPDLHQEQKTSLKRKKYVREKYEETHTGDRETNVWEGTQGSFKGVPRPLLFLNTVNKPQMVPEYYD